MLSWPVRAIVLTTAPALVSVLALAMATWHCSNVKVFLSPYLLNMLMDQIDFLPDSRYWSEVLCCTITTHGHGHRNFVLKILVKVCIP